MEIIIKSLTNEKKGSIALPRQFEEQVRPDLIRKVVLARLSNKRQPYGSKPEAGKRASATLSRRRHDYKGSYGHGISRVPRKIMSRSGTRFNWVGAFAPGTVGGRKAHPPKAEKKWKKSINIKENRKAIRSALKASVTKGIVAQRGHDIPEDFPFIIEKGIQDVKTTKQAKKLLQDIGFSAELERIGRKSIRSGKGKMRARKYKKIRGMLLVVDSRCAAKKAFSNIPGVEVCSVDKLNAEKLAPGAVPGRLVLFTEAAIEKLDKKRLFM